jgi:hypothetical protein
MFAMQKSKVLEIASKCWRWLMDWGQLIIKNVGKVILALVASTALLLGAFAVALSLGVIAGTYMRFMHDGSRFYFHVGKDWAEKALKQPVGQINSFEAKTVSDKVKFIDLSHDSLVRHWKDRKLSDVQVIKRRYFNTEELPYGTTYIPWLWTPNDPDTPLTVLNDHLAEIVVVLIEHQGVEPKIGMIALDDYEEYLRRAGLAKKGAR